MKTEFFKWKADYSVNNQKIDEQHKKIIKMLNELYDAFLNKEHEDVIGKIISNMAEYAVYHFKTEEQYFQKFEYENKREHIKEHNKFLEQVRTFQSEYNKNKSALTFRIVNFLKEWLSEHILISDKKYIKCFTENGLK